MNPMSERTDMPHHDAPHRVPAITSHQQLQASAAWAIIRQQCPRNYELLRAKFETEYGTHLHLRALTAYLRRPRAPAHEAESQARRPGPG